MAGFLQDAHIQIVLTPVHACAHPWGLRILTDANFIPLLHASAFNYRIVLPVHICELTRQPHCRVFRFRLVLEGSDGRLDRQAVSDGVVAVESLQRRIANGAAIFAWHALLSRQLDPAETCSTFGAGHVVLFHQIILRYLPTL
jgi:hypothetical protein